MGAAARAGALPKLLLTVAAHAALGLVWQGALPRGRRGLRAGAVAALALHACSGVVHRRARALRCLGAALGLGGCRAVPIARAVAAAVVRGGAARGGRVCLGTAAAGLIPVGRSRPARALACGICAVPIFHAPSLAAMCSAQGRRMRGSPPNKANPASNETGFALQREAKGFRLWSLSPASGACTPGERRAAGPRQRCTASRCPR